MSFKIAILRIPGTKLTIPEYALATYVDGEEKAVEGRAERRDADAGGPPPLILNFSGCPGDGVQSYQCSFLGGRNG